MAEQRLSHLLLGYLRHFGILYGGVRWFYRILTRQPLEILRRFSLFSNRFGPASGFFSGVEQVRKGEGESALILEAQDCEPFGENTLVHLSQLGQDQNQPWPIFWIKIPSARLIGSSLALVNPQNQLMAESTFSQLGEKTDGSYWHLNIGKPQRIAGNATSLISRWGQSGYWHWLMDSLPRLALLPDFPADTRILVPPLRPWMRWFLDRLQVTSRCFETQARNVMVDDYFFSSPTSMTGCYNPYAVKFLRDNFLPHASVDVCFPKKFYIVREGYTRGVRNEREVRRFFEDQGWALIAPETLSINEQITLFAGAEAIAGIHGSALTNLVWCSPGCRVLEFAPENFLAGAFEIVAKILHLPHGFIICEADPHSQVRIDINLLAKTLKQQ